MIRTSFTEKRENFTPQKCEAVKGFEHRIVLPGGTWALWKWVAVRGAGFPASGVLNLAAPAAAAACDALQLGEEEMLVAKSQALELVNSELDTLRKEGSWHDRGPSWSVDESAQAVV